MWIKTSKNRPKYGELVWFVWNNYTDYGMWDGIFISHSNGCEYENIEVPYWMELIIPEPPKE